MANKKRKCIGCKQYTEVSQGIIVGNNRFACSIECAVEAANRGKSRGAEKIKRHERAENRKAKDTLKTKGDIAKEAQKACNRYIRARDRVDAINRGVLPMCCSCENSNQNIQYAAGHYKTVGAHQELRFNEFNIHLQCNKRCNKELSGNINGTNDSDGYTRFMEKTYGKEFVDSLNSRRMPKYTIDELKEIKKLYNYFANELEKEWRRRQDSMIE